MLENMKNKTELIKSLQSRAQDSPYQVEETDYGFVLTLNIVDKKWYTILQKNGVDKTFHIDGLVDEKNHTVATTDTMKTLRWRAGGLAPTIGGSLAVEKGELNEKGFEIQFGVSEKGKPGTPVDYAYDLSAVKKWLDEGLHESGYRRVLGTTAKVGIAIAIAAGVLAVLVVIGLLIVM